MPDALLPQGFEALEEFAERWTLATEAERFRARLEASLEEIRRFYDASLPHMDRALTHLAGRPPDGGDERSRRLLYLAMAFMDVSRVVEVWQQVDVRTDCLTPDRFHCSTTPDGI